MLNKCIIQGRLTADPEIKTVKNIDKCDFTIAVQRSYDREAADFITLSNDEDGVAHVVERFINI